MVQPTTQTRGFSLIETLLYVALAAGILFVVASFIISVLEVRVKTETIATVDQEGNHAVAIMTQTIRNAVAINTPATSTEGSVLSLNTGVAGNDPTVFQLAGGVITMTEGANSAVPLTSNLVVVSNLMFHNLSKPNTPGNVDISFTVDHVH